MPSTKILGLSIALSIFLCAGTASAQSKPAPDAPSQEEARVTLKVGDAAPGLTVERWVKGDPVKNLAAGKVYVVEFWATWCGPCVKAIPKVSALQKKHKDLTVIAVAGSERDDGTKLTDFVKEQGDKMAYRVAHDTDRSMAEAWMKPAGLRGIPSAFVVDHEGKIAWIGHPANGLDNAAEQALVKAQAAANEAEKEKRGAFRFEPAAQGPVMAFHPAAQDAKPAKKDEPAKPDKPAPLSIGDPAPKLQVGSWVKGKEVTGFEAGTVYVVEFWATWCGPCRATIPHLTELAKKNPEVRFIGVSVWESDPSQSAVPKFVESMGDKMDYSVATDSIAPGKEPNDGAMARNWMAAAGQDGIPAAFIVNKEGKVAWIGHPMEMEKPLAEIKAGTFDIAKAAAKAKEERELSEKMQPIQRKIAAARQARDWDAMLAGLDEMSALSPDAAANAAIQKFQVLMQGKRDGDAALALAAKLADNELKGSAEGLNQIAWTILDTPRLPKRDFDLAQRMAQRAVELTKGENAAILDTLARAYWEKKDVANAIKYQVLAVEKETDAEAKKELEETLKKYRAGGA